MLEPGMRTNSIFLIIHRKITEADGVFQTPEPLTAVKPERFLEDTVIRQSELRQETAGPEALKQNGHLPAPAPSAWLPGGKPPPAPPLFTRLLGHLGQVPPLLWALSLPSETGGVWNHLPGVAAGLAVLSLAHGCQLCWFRAGGRVRGSPSVSGVFSVRAESALLLGGCILRKGAARTAAWPALCGASHGGPSCPLTLPSSPPSSRHPISLPLPSLQL